MDISSLIKYGFQSLFKGMIVAIITLLGILFGHMIALLLGFNMPSTPIFLESSKSAFYYITIMITIAILVGELFKKLNQPFKERFITIAFYHFLFYYLLRIGDGFLSNVKLSFSYDIFIFVLATLIFAFLVAFLWKPKEQVISVTVQMKSYFSIRSKSSWVFRFMIGWLCFIPIYYFTNWFISPFIEPYYADISNQVGEIPNIYITTTVNVIIGAFFVAVIMPIFILWQQSKTSLLFWIGFPVFVQVAVPTFIIELSLPLGIRFPYLIQYTVITYLMAIIFVQLFFVPKESEVIDDQFKWMY